MTRETLYKKTEAPQISGKSTMLTPSVTRSWCHPTCKKLMLPTTELEQSEIRRKPKLLIDHGLGPARVESR